LAVSVKSLKQISDKIHEYCSLGELEEIIGYNVQPDSDEDDSDNDSSLERGISKARVSWKL
jgi:hypothetical protein